MNFSFEQGPIRPPSEAKSLLLRVTRNCPWNKCAFCHSYHDRKFGLRSVEDVRKDIDEARRIADDIGRISWKMGEGGAVSEAVIDGIFRNEGLYNDSYRSIAAWLYYGGESVFLQDANSIIAKTDDLVDILTYLRDTFPQVTRVTSYCRSKTACRKSVEEFRRLKEAGLNRIHIGLESGCDPVLEFIRKGVTAEEHIEGGRRIVASGLSLSEYIIPGLGGTRWSREHALETARVLNAINPDYIRLRSLQVRRGTALYGMMKEGRFTPLHDEEVVREIRLLLANLEGIESRVVSDHILNLLEELEGKLPEDRDRLLGIIDGYFALPEDDRLVYRLGRRKGIYRSLGDLSDRRVYGILKGAIDGYKAGDPGELDRDLHRIMHNYI
ncbi:MAG TPA: radical SAM protein [Syntrophales bacterium]|nr:radical SAM protein [Syntrophales bacterium]